MRPRMMLVLLGLVVGVIVGRFGPLIIPGLSVALLVVIACFFGWVAYTTRFDSKKFTPALVDGQFAAISCVLGINIAAVWEAFF